MSGEQLATGGEGESGQGLVTRVVISICACTLVTWQLAATASFGPSPRWTWRCIRVGGTPLQWYLSTLMALSVLEAVLATVADVTLYMRKDAFGHTTASDMQEEIQLNLMMNQLSELTLSLAIIGLGISGWANGLWHGKAATALGLASLTIRTLPAPLVLVLGVSALQTTRPRGERHGCSCCSLSCALKPLLALALMESLYASLVADKEFVQRMDTLTHDPLIRAEVMHSLGDGEVAAREMEILDVIRPEQMLKCAIQSNRRPARLPPHLVSSFLFESPVWSRMTGWQSSSLGSWSSWELSSHSALVGMRMGSSTHSSQSLPSWCPAYRPPSLLCSTFYWRRASGREAPPYCRCTVLTPSPICRRKKPEIRNTSVRIEACCLTCEACFLTRQAEARESTAVVGHSSLHFTMMLTMMHPHVPVREKSGSGMCLYRSSPPCEHPTAVSRALS